MLSPIARTCVVLVASHITKKSATASGIFLRSKETMLSPFLSCIALIMLLKILEFLVSLVSLLFLRDFKTDKGANKPRIYSDEFVRPVAVVHSTCFLYFRSSIFAKNRNLLSSHSNSHIIGKPFIQLAKVDSTNNYAMAQIHNGLADHGSTFFAQAQTGGKGQRGKQWIAAEGLNIMQTSVLNAAAFHLSNPFTLTVIAANACCEFFGNYAGSETSIKWPNDIYWRDRKAGGILIENIIRGNRWLWAMVGIGININQTAFVDLPNPVSLKQITGKNYDPPELGRELCSYVDRHYRQYLNIGFLPALELYNQQLYKKDMTAQLKKDNVAFSCTIKEVEENGDLVVTDSSWDRFAFGEVEWIMQ
jgi:BirA family transcriptional regulator, biotin operon repressor / biotin---[acetyl-CoA-carboxylase] ligase